MKILVPVDFKKASFAAFVYATEMAHLLGAEITLIHVLEGTFNFNDAISYEPILTSSDNAKKRLKYFALEYPKENGVQIKDTELDYKVRFGIPGFTISDFANDNHMDLVIMGSRDRHGIFERLMGTSSAITIKQTKCPVLLVHESTRFNIPKKLVFAIDGKADLDESLESFLNLNNILKASTHFVNVKTKYSAYIDDTVEEINEEIFKKNDLKFDYIIKRIEGRNVKNALFDYCIFEKADMLVMVHRHKGFFDEFLNSSVSIKIAQNLHLPVIVYNEY